MSTAQLHQVPDSAGGLLKNLRLEQQLTVQDVAKKLKLDSGIIEVLESNDFDALPAATYARGYLRSYARLVGADADMIITLYDDNAPEPPEIIPDIRHPTQISSSDKPVKVITWLISLVLALLLLSWVQSRYLLQPTEPEQEPASGDAGWSTAAADLQAPADPGDAYNEQDLLSEIPGTWGEPSADISIDDLAADGGAMPVEAAGAEEAPAPVTVTGAVDMIDPEGQAQSGEIAANQAEEPAASGTPAEAGGETGAPVAPDDYPPGTDTISLRLTADSWIEIYDRYDRKLYMDLARTGEEISLAGTAPFYVKLGFSQGVVLQFNGKPYDHAPYSRAGVARFTLGGSR